MSDVEVTFSLPEALVREAKAFGILTSEHLETLLRADIQAQLVAMASDTEVLREITQIQSEFSDSEYDGLEMDQV